MRTASTYYRLALATAVGAGLFLLWGIGALGIIGSGGPPDLMYVAALAVGLVGAVAVRFRPRGMAGALAVTAAATFLVGIVAIVAGQHRNEGASVLEILGLSTMYAGLFGLSAWLFHRAAEQGVPSASGGHG